MTSVGALNLILDKIGSKDKDFRWMATSDLHNELQKPGFKTEPDMERRLCNAVLLQLDDNSGEISGLAVKCLGALANNVGEDKVRSILTSLCDKLMSGKKDSQRETASLGLKAVIADLSASRLAALSFTVPSIVLPKLKQGLQTTGSQEVITECLDILTEVLQKFGRSMKDKHLFLKDILLKYFADSRSVVRKKTVTCVATLSPYIPDEQLNQILAFLLDGLSKKSTKPEARQAHVHTLGLISHGVGWKINSWLDRAVPVVIQQCRAAPENDEELKDFCLQALEAFVLKAPQASRAHLKGILPLALEYLSFDPNYADDMDEDDEEQDEDEDEMSDEGYSDDDDASWKVRRAASKCISAVINSYPDLIDDVYPELCSPLLARFREREENVKMDIFTTFTDLLRQVANTASSFDGNSANSPVAMLRKDSQNISKAAARQLKEKSLKARSGILVLLKELATVLPEQIPNSLSQLIPGIQQALQDKSAVNSGLKIQALLFLKSAMARSAPEPWQPYLPQLSTALFKAVGERYYKIAAEALRACEQLMRVIRPSLSQPISQQHMGPVQPLFQCVMQRLSGQDQDQEVKECAITCMASIIACLGDVLLPEVPQALRVLLDRLRNEITRLTAVKAITTVAQSSLPIDLNLVIEPVLTELTGFMRKANRPLKQASLSAMEALVARHGPRKEQAALQAADAAASVVTETDLVLTGLALRFCTTLLRQQRSLGPHMTQRVLPQALTLIKSPLLQGAALEALQVFFATLVLSGVPEASAPKLIDAIMTAARQESHAAKQAAATCIAVLATAEGASQVPVTLQVMLDTLQGKRADGGSRYLALLGLGEIGRTTDLSRFNGVHQAVTSALEGSSSDELRASASHALGGLAVGSTSAFLPFILQQIQAQAGKPKEQYLLLRSLNEVIVSFETSSSNRQQITEGQQDQIMQLLLANCEADEECRNMVAECLGHLALLNPQKLVPSLRSQTQAGSVNLGIVVVLAARFMVNERPHPVDHLLQGSIGEFLQSMSSPDRHLRRAAVQLLSAAAHHKPQLVVSHLPSVMPVLYEQAKVDPSMVREVDLGPFKHKIDDGLELRKAAFECMGVLLDACPNRIDPASHLRLLESGLQDNYDVKMPCHSLLARMSQISPGPVLAELDRLVEPLTKTLTAPVKSSAVKQEIDRNEDMIRSCLRAVDAVSRIHNIETNAAFKNLMTNTVSKGTLQSKLKTIREERAEAEGTGIADKP